MTRNTTLKTKKIKCVGIDKKNDFFQKFLRRCKTYSRKTCLQCIKYRVGPRNVQHIVKSWKGEAGKKVCAKKYCKMDNVSQRVGWKLENRSPDILVYVTELRLFIKVCARQSPQFVKKRFLNT